MVSPNLNPVLHSLNEWIFPLNQNPLNMAKIAVCRWGCSGGSRAELRCCSTQVLAGKN